MGCDWMGYDGSRREGIPYVFNPNYKENLGKFWKIFWVVLGYFIRLIGSGIGLGRSGMSSRFTRINFQVKRTILRSNG